ncbi:TPA: heme ABC transporter ATP-binding protein [Klebsiella pneumoniae]|nr:heme ABC transporter ATP-binding protein [Klebsiella pneumoniae]
MRPALARRLLLMTLLLVSLTLFATTLGAMRLPLVNLLPSGDDMLRHIWLTIRLPRVLLALLVGAALALSGCVMQGLFRNPLADPGLLGISSGAALAVASWLVLPFSAAGLIALYMPMLAAFIGSLAVMVVIFILSRAEEGSLSRLLLVGIAINALCGALVGVLSWLSNDAQLRQLSLWGMGSLGQAEWPTLLVAATLIIPAALAVWWMASRLNLLQLGDEEAHYLGVNVQALQRWLLLCSAVLVAAAVAISGVIGFIGLVVPHLMRLLTGYLTPDSGTRHLAGKPLEAWSPEALSRRRAVMLQRTALQADWTVETVIAMGRSPWGATADPAVLAAVMAVTGCDGLAGRRYPGLSGGEQQRVQLARCLAQLWRDGAPQGWLFLDEPTSALDLYYQQHLLRLLKRLTAGGQLHVCVVLHDLNLAALWADRILLLHQGHLVAQGTPQEVIQQPVIHRWYGADVRLVQHPDNAVPQVYLAP